MLLAHAASLVAGRDVQAALSSKVRDVALSVIVHTEANDAAVFQEQKVVEAARRDLLAARQPRRLRPWRRLRSLRSPPRFTPETLFGETAARLVCTLARCECREIVEIRVLCDSLLRQALSLCCRSPQFFCYCRRC